MTSITYVGPCEGVDLPTVGLTAKRGESIDVPTEVAASLLDGGDFERTKAKKASAAKKAAAKSSAPADEAASADEPKSEED